MEIYTILDKKAGVHLNPFFVRHEVDAVRRVTAGVADPKTTLSQYSDDYSLVRVGKFDDETGKIVPCHVVVIPSLATVRDMLVEKGNQNVAS